MRCMKRCMMELPRRVSCYYDAIPNKKTGMKRPTRKKSHTGGGADIRKRTNCIAYEMTEQRSQITNLRIQTNTRNLKNTVLLGET